MNYPNTYFFEENHKRQGEIKTRKMEKNKAV